MVLAVHVEARPSPGGRHYSPLSFPHAGGVEAWLPDRSPGVPGSQSGQKATANVTGKCVGVTEEGRGGGIPLKAIAKLTS